MILALDSYYKNDICNTSLIVFENRDSDKSIYEDTIYTKVTSEYIPGEFYKRELPGIKKILNKFIKEHKDMWNNIYYIIVDSYITLKLGDKEWDGLGAYVYKYLLGIEQHKIVYGVAKSKFGDCDKISYKVFRGKSKTPLYVQTTEDTHIAKLNIQQMHGNYRIPTMLKEVDRLSRIFV